MIVIFLFCTVLLLFTLPAHCVASLPISRMYAVCIYHNDFPSSSGCCCYCRSMAILGKCVLERGGREEEGTHNIAMRFPHWQWVSRVSLIAIAAAAVCRCGVRRCRRHRHHHNTCVRRTTTMCECVEVFCVLCIRVR